VLYHTRLSDVVACLESLITSATQLDGIVHCYLIDNSVSLDYAELLAESVANVKHSDQFIIYIVESSVNNGYGAANNSVSRDLDSNYHLVINPDVVVDSAALLSAVEFLQSSPAVGMVTPYVEAANDTACHVVKSYPDCLTLLVRFLGWRFIKRLFRRRLSAYSFQHVGLNVVNVELAGGCFFFLRTELFRRISGFDTRYFLYFEDFDFCIRLRPHALISYVPQVKIAHSGGDVGRKASMHHRYFMASAFRFFSTHGWKLF